MLAVHNLQASLRSTTLLVEVALSNQELVAILAAGNLTGTTGAIWHVPDASA